MQKRILSPVFIRKYRESLVHDEKSNATIEKYMHDIRTFSEFAQTQNITKELTLAYKNMLLKNYAVTSANSMLAALNSFLQFAGWHDAKVKQFKVQKKAYCKAEKELTKQEYMRLIDAAEKKSVRLSLVIQTICCLGIRVSELACITVEALQNGEAVVSCKGKTRTILIVSALRKKLLKYVRSKGIKMGPVFVTKNGRPLNRCNIWREMKGLGCDAHVLSEKIFPHNLRHLFARTFYAMEKDIANLADILGHSSINTTRIYIITTGAEHRRKMERLQLIS
ncbi:MAG: tyrosine-type recombinase/integrase [Clostridia bacterium]|nr:tyrosine-type recombinase/integrase [Clostridia bacterium]